MSRKKVLIIAYYFPPSGGGGIQRIVKLVKYLSRLGWEPYILTVKAIHYKTYDETPLEEILDVPVIRAGSLDPLRIAHILRGTVYTGGTEHIPGFSTLETMFGAEVAAYSFSQRLTKVMLDVFFPPDIAVFWVPFAIARGFEVCRREGINALYSISPQESAHLIGNGLSKLTGLPWVADMTDPWSTRHWRLKLPIITRYINRKLEQSVIDGADAILTSTRTVADYIAGRLIRKKTVWVLSNGFDREDYTGKLLKKEPGDFNIVHIGILTGENGVGNIISGFAAAMENDTRFARAAKLYMLGGNPGEYRVLADKLGVSDRVFAPGYLPYRDAVKAAASADLNLLQMGTEVGEAVVPGKFYIYLGAEKPIMAVVPEGEAKRLTTELCEARFLASPEEVSGITDAFLSAFNDRAPQRINWEKAKRYDYENIAGEIAELLDKLTAKLRL